MPFKNLLEIIGISDLTPKFEITVHLQSSGSLPLQKCGSSSSLTSWSTISEVFNFVKGGIFQIIAAKDSNFLIYTV